jgi:hypothetical protein
MFSDISYELGQIQHKILKKINFAGTYGKFIRQVEVRKKLLMLGTGDGEWDLR